MNDNDRLFNKIGVDIRMWRDNAHPPRITWIWILSITFSLLNAGVWIYVYTYWWSSWWFQCTAIFVGMCLFPFLFMKIFGTLPGSWPEVLDSKLAIYKPLNIGAWQCYNPRLPKERSFLWMLFSSGMRQKKNTGMK